MPGAPPYIAIEMVRLFVSISPVRAKAPGIRIIDSDGRKMISAAAVFAVLPVRENHIQHLLRGSFF